MAKGKEEAIEARLMPVAQAQQCTVVDVEFRKEDSASHLCIYIDKDGGVSLDTCEAFHMAILDLLQDIPYDYLEVSSPGDRPLKKEADFLRMMGKPVEVKLYAAYEGNKLYQGRLEGRDEEGTITLCIEEKGKTRRVLLKKQQIALVRPWFTL